MGNRRDNHRGRGHRQSQDTKHTRGNGLQNKTGNIKFKMKQTQRGVLRGMLLDH